MHAALCHLIATVARPTPGQQPRYAQLFVVDSKTAATLRARRTDLKPALMAELTAMLERENVFVRAFRRFTTDETPTLRLIVRTPDREGVRDVGGPLVEAQVSVEERCSRGLRAAAGRACRAHAASARRAFSTRACIVSLFTRPRSLKRLGAAAERVQR